MQNLVFFFLLLNASLPAQEPTPVEFASLYEQGIASFRAEKYEEARETFEKALSLQPDNASALTNLGLTYFKLEEEGRAAAYFRKALSRAPGLDTAEKALEFSYSKLPAQAKAHPTGSWSWVTVDIVRKTPLGIFLLFTLFSLFAAGWTGLQHLGRRRRAYRDETALPPLPIVPSLLSLFFIFFTALSLIKFWDQSQSRATIVAEIIEAHSGPGESYPSLFDIVEGSQVEIRSLQSEWVQVTDAKGLTGWVPLTSLIITSGPQS